MKTILFSVIYFIAFSLTAQESNHVKLDSLFSVIEQNNKAMGSFSIYRNGKEIYTNTIGFSDVEARKEAGADTRYRVGSITKTFTAVLIMQLIEEGKLQLDTRLSTFYAQIPNSDKIVIEDLLRHQSGLYNFSKTADFDQWKGKKQTKEDHLNRIASSGTVFQPREKSEYSNTNYILLSFNIEDLEKKDYSEVLCQRILKPLQLANTYYGHKVDPAKGEALAYRQTGEWSRLEETDMSVVKGAGAMMSTPADLNKFYTALFTGKVVKPASLAKMTEVKGEFGLGIFELPLVGKTFYGHTGGIDGYDAVVTYLPEENISIAYCSNARDMAPHSILDGAAHIYFGLPYELPSFRTVALTVEELKQFEGTYRDEDFPLF